MRHWERKFGLALALLVLCAGAANAQKSKDKEDASTRAVQGLVVDPGDAPVSGAVVQLKDMRTLQIRSFITQSDGTYHFSGLKTETEYQVKADFSGMSSPSKGVSVFDNSKVAVRNLKLEKK